MYRLLFALPIVMFGCSPDNNVVDLGDNPDDVPEFSPEDLERMEDATFHVISPKAGALVPWGEANTFEAELVDAEGEPIAFTAVQWTSNRDDAWAPSGMSLVDTAITVGLHNITAEVQLPTGDTLRHTVGGVRVQSAYAGTYVGTFIANTELQGLPVGCAGAAVLMVDPYGQELTGDADCVISLGGTGFALEFVFDMENDDGELDGITAADVFGTFQIDYDAEGTLRSNTIDMSFGGDGGFLPMDGTLEAPRVSLDCGLE